MGKNSTGMNGSIIRNNIIVATMLLSLGISLTGCGSSDTPDASNRASGTSSSVENVLQQGMAEAESTDSTTADGQTEDGGYSFDRQTGISAGAPDPEEAAKDALLSSTEGIDVDLTMHHSGCDGMLCPGYRI